MSLRAMNRGIVDALGFDPNDVTSLTLTVLPNALPIVEATFLDLEKLVHVVRRFELREVEDD